MYSLGAFGFLAIIIFSTSCFCYYKARVARSQMSHKKRHNCNVEILANLEAEPRNIQESPYASIDENDVLDFEMSERHLRRQSQIDSCDVTTASSVENDGYLKPIPDDSDNLNSNTGSLQSDIKPIPHYIHPYHSVQNNETVFETF